MDIQLQAQSPFSSRRSSIQLSIPAVSAAEKWISINASSSTSENYKWLFPSSAPSVGQYLQVSSISIADTLAWTSPSGLLGSGVAARLAYWDSTTSLSQSAELQWNNSSSYLGISSSAPSSFVHSEISAAGGSLSSLGVNNQCFFSENTTNSGSSGFQFIGLNNSGVQRIANLGINPIFLNQAGDCVVAANGTSDGAYFFDLQNGNGVVGGTYGTFNIVNKFAVNGSASVGTAYREVAAPSNGFIVEGIVGIGKSSSLTQQLTVYNGTTTGTYTTSGWIHSSDRLLKTSIQPLANCLENVRRLQGLSFNWISDPHSHHQIGFIAQDVEQVYPELVFSARDSMGTKSIALANISAVHNEAIKSLANRVDSAERRQAARSAGVQKAPLLSSANSTASNALSSAPIVYIKKTSIETSTNPSLQLDDELRFRLPAHSRWLVEYVLDLGGNSTLAQVQIQRSCQGAPLREAVGELQWRLRSASVLRKGQQAISEAIKGLRVQDASTQLHVESVIQIGDRDEDVELLWAPEGADGCKLQVGPNSYLKATRLP